MNDTLMRDLYLSAVLTLWDKGLNTADIAETLCEHQAAVERALHAALERRQGRRHMGTGDKHEML